MSKTVYEGGLRSWSVAVSLVEAVGIITALPETLRAYPAVGSGQGLCVVGQYVQEHVL